MDLLRRIAAILLIALAVAGLGAWAWRLHAPKTTAPTQKAGRVQVVYYLHGAIRCVTCNSIQKSTEHALAAFTPVTDTPRPELRKVAGIPTERPWCRLLQENSEPLSTSHRAI